MDTLPGPQTFRSLTALRSDTPCPEGAMKKLAMQMPALVSVQ